MIAGSEIGNGAASSLTERVSRSPSRASNARRVGSDSAAKVRSSASPLYLTIVFSIGAKLEASSGNPGATNSAKRAARVALAVAANF